MSKLNVPVRHGEGRIIFDSGRTLRQVTENNQIVFQYADLSGAPTETFPENPNGTAMGIAGLCDKTGRIMGMMPHPEAYVDPWTHPDYNIRRKEVADEGEGLVIFRNAVSFVETQL